MPSRSIQDKGTQGSGIKVVRGSTKRNQGIHDGASIGLQSRLARAVMLSHPIAKLHEHRWLRGDGIWLMFSRNDLCLLKVLQQLARTAHVIIVYPSKRFALTAWEMPLELLDTDRIKLGKRPSAEALPVAHMRC
jgi:hypothetical protein